MRKIQFVHADWTSILRGLLLKLCANVFIDQTKIPMPVHFIKVTVILLFSYLCAFVDESQISQKLQCALNICDAHKTGKKFLKGKVFRS